MDFPKNQFVPQKLNSSSGKCFSVCKIIEVPGNLYNVSYAVRCRAAYLRDSLLSATNDFNKKNLLFRRQEKRYIRGTWKIFSPTLTGDI